MKDKSKRLTVINTSVTEKSDSPGSDSTNRKPSISPIGLNTTGNFLLKSTWNEAWEIKSNEEGRKYIYGKLPLVLQYGLTMYAGKDGVNIPSIYDGLPIDSQTIYWEDIKDDNGVVVGKILKAKIGGGTLGSLTNIGEWADSVADVDRVMVQKKGSDTWEAMDVSGIGSASFENIFEGGDGNAYTSFVLSGDKKSITLMKGMKFATTDDLDKRINNLINGAPAAYDTLKEIADVLQGNVNSIGDIITTLGTKWTQDDTKIANWDAAYSWGDHSKAGYAAKSYVDSTFVPIKGDCNIEGIKNFIGSLQVNGSPIVYDKEKGYWYFTGDMIVSGGITMFGNTQGFEPSTIMDGVHVDGVTIIKENGRLVALGGGGSGGSELDTVAWGNVLGKPSWITDDKPECVNPFSLSWNGRETGSYNGSMGKSFYIPAKLSELTDDVVSGKYLPLTGGILSGQIEFSGTTYPHIYGNGTYLILGHANQTSYGLVIGKGYIRGHHNNTQTIGVVDNRWSNIYSVLGNFSGQITSTVADGTAPFFVASKTEVANLHSATATKLHTPITLWGNTFDGTKSLNSNLVLYNSGNYSSKTTDGDVVGLMYLNNSNDFLIGQDVARNGRNTFIYGDNITLSYGTEGSSTYTGLKLETNGNIAIPNGLTIGSSTSDNSKYKLNVAGMSLFGDVLLLKNHVSIRWLSRSDTEHILIRLNNNKNFILGNVNLGTYVDGNTVNLRYGSDYTIGFVLNESGNIGIGTTSPAYKLDVNGTLRVANDASFRKNLTVWGSSPREINRKATSAQIYVNGIGGEIEWGLGVTSTIATAAGTVVNSGVGIVLGNYNNGNYGAPIGRGAGIAAVAEDHWYNRTGIAFYVNHNTSRTSDDFTEKMRLTHEGNLVPKHSLTQTLGSSSNYWGNTYTKLATIDGVQLKKSQNDTLYLDGNLVVRGGITMYGTDTTSTPSIFDSLPIASTSAKGIAQFSGDYFTVSDGIVRIIDGSVGLKESELNAILDGKNYATKTDLRGYLPLSGGIINGKLTVTHNTWNVLDVVRTGVNGTSGISFYTNSTLIGSIGVHGAASAYPGQPVFITPDNHNYKIYTENNFPPTEILTQLKTVDGANSGLDADLLDGNHASRFIGLYTRNDIGSAPNYDNPSVNGLFEIRGTSETPNETGTKPFDRYAPFFSMKAGNVIMQITGTSYWNTGWWIRGKQSANPTLEGVSWERLVIEDAQLREWDIKVKSATKLKTAVTLWGNEFDGSSSVNGQLKATKGIHINTSTDSYPLLISRNGDLSRERTSIYQNDLGLIFDVLNDEKTSRVFFNFSAIDTENSDGTDAKSGTVHFGINEASHTYVNAYEFQGIASSATKLQTPRTIWGKTFDGTANISGNLTDVGFIYGTGDLNLSSPNSVQMRINMSESAAVALTSAAFRPLNNSNNLLDLGASNARWRKIFGQDLDIANKERYSLIKHFGINGGYALIAGYRENEYLRIDGYDESNNYTSKLIQIDKNYYTNLLKANVGGGFEGDRKTEYTLGVYGTLGVTGASTFKAQTTHNAGLLSTTGSFSDSVTINGIKINKSQDGTLYLDGNLVVKGGITMYGTDATNTPSILDSLPKASYGSDDDNKGIASFDGSYFRVTDGYVSLIADSVGLNEDRLGAYLVEKGYLTTSNYNSYAPTLTGGGASGNWNIYAKGITPIGRITDDSFEYFNNSIGFTRGISICRVESSAVGDIPAYSTVVTLGVDASRFIRLASVKGTGRLVFQTANATNNGFSSVFNILTDQTYGTFLDSVYLKQSSYTAADILAKLKTVDGDNSGLDADLLDGLHSTSLMKFDDYTDYVRASFVSDTLAERASSKYIEFWHNDKWFNIQAGKIKAHSGFEGSLTGNADTATALSDSSSYTIFGNTFFVNGKPQSISSLSNGSWLKINNTGGTEMRLVGFNSSNQAFFGFDSRENNYDTYVDGGTLHIRSKNGYIDITSSGYVGVNKSPSYNFDVSGIIHATSDIMADGDMSADYMYANRFSINTSNYITTSGGYLSLNTASNELSISGTSNSNIHVNYRTAANGYAPSKWIWLAGSSGSYAAFSIGDLTVNGNILSTGGITMYSQRSLKNVVDERGLSLNELSAIKPTRYTWRDGRDNNIHIGGIADDVKQVLPEVVYKTKEGILTMDYGNAGFAIAASLIKPVVDHEEKIRQLQKRVSELEQELNRLRA